MAEMGINDEHREECWRSNTIIMNRFKAGRFGATAKYDVYNRTNRSNNKRRKGIVREDAAVQIRQVQKTGDNRFKITVRLSFSVFASIRINSAAVVRYCCSTQLLSVYPR